MQRTFEDELFFSYGLDTILHDDGPCVAGTLRVLSGNYAIVDDLERQVGAQGLGFSDPRSVCFESYLLVCRSVFQGGGTAFPHR